MGNEGASSPLKFKASPHRSLSESANYHLSLRHDRQFIWPSHTVSTGGSQWNTTMHDGLGGRRIKEGYR